MDKKSNLVLKQLYRGEVVRERVTTNNNNKINHPLIIKYPSSFSWYLGNKKLTLNEAKIYSLLHEGYLL